MTKNVSCSFGWAWVVMLLTLTLMLPSQIQSTHRIPNSEPMQCELLHLSTAEAPCDSCQLECITPMAITALLPPSAGPVHTAGNIRPIFITIDYSNPTDLPILKPPIS